MTDNPNCSSSGPHESGEVKRMPTGEGDAVILCRACWLKELAWRRACNKSLAAEQWLDLPDWDSAEVYTAFP